MESLNYYKVIIQLPEIKNLIIIKLPNRKLISLNKYYNNYKYFGLNRQYYLKTKEQLEKECEIFYTGNEFDCSIPKIPKEILNRLTEVRIDFMSQENFYIIYYNGISDKYNLKNRHFNFTTISY